MPTNGPAAEHFDYLDNGEHCWDDMTELDDPEEDTDVADEA